MLLRLLMASDAPLHIKRIFLHHERHLIDTPVTTYTTHAFTYVNAMIKVDKVR